MRERVRERTASSNLLALRLQLAGIQFQPRPAHMGGDLQIGAETRVCAMQHRTAGEDYLGLVRLNGINGINGISERAARMRKERARAPVRWKWCPIGSE